MRFKNFLFCILMLVFAVPIQIVYAAVAVKKYDINELPAKNYILVDAKSGQVLYAKNADVRCSIGSMTKIMVMLKTAELIDDGIITLDDVVKVTETAHPTDNGETVVWLEIGEKITVRELLLAVALRSAGDAARTLAEYISYKDNESKDIEIVGSEEAGVQLMNDKAKDLFMTNTHFSNAAGMDDDENYSTARDVAKMARELLLKHKWITGFTSKKEAIIRDGQSKLNNTNTMLLSGYNGCNGLKTGTTDDAGLCLCGTAERNKRLLIAVSVGSNRQMERIDTIKSLFDYGFNNFANLNVSKEKISNRLVNVSRGQEPFVGIELEDEDVLPLINKKDINKVQTEVDLYDNVKAPVKKGDVVGKYRYFLGDEEICSKNLVSTGSVKEINWFYLFSSVFKSFFCDAGI